MLLLHQTQWKNQWQGDRQYSEEAGGMEVPCELKFSGSARKVRKLRQLLTDLDSPPAVVVSSLITGFMLFSCIDH